MRIVIHADDVGASPGITDSILHCVEAGALRSVSLLATGADFSRAAKLCRSRPDLRSTLHLNFAEGQPLLAANEVPDLVDANGCFRHSFISLWTVLECPNRERRHRVGEQLLAETRAQIRSFREEVGTSAPISLDSHRHYHLIPGVLDIVLEAAKELAIGRVRTVRERFALASFSMDVSLVTNAAKHFLLNALSRRAEPKLDAAGIAHPAMFVGVLYSGRVTVASIRAALSAASRDWDARSGEVEILLHPGAALASEAALWRHQPMFASFYLDSARSQEGAVLRSAELAELLVQIAAPA